ncbi:hypothetical protein Btru_060792, partial [Bulinus truncatus]
IEVSISQVKSNACHECLRHPDTCRRISGLYTVTVLSEGSYNPVVEIPTPACSINITEFKESSNYIALKTKRDKGIINSYWSLGEPGQYDGAGTTFTYDRRSPTCKGVCIHADGPTSEILVVQLRTMTKTTGIAYTFTLPNSVPFTSFNGPVVKTGYRQQYANLTDEGRADHAFEGEYYAGHHSSRSEGRPDVTSSLSSHNKPAARHTDYIRYGTHTLGGRGLSYNLGGDALSSRRDEVDRPPGRHIVDRVQPYTSSNSRSSYPNIRKLPSPEYIAHPRHQQNVQSIAGRPEPLYHRTSLGGANLDSVETEQFDITNNLNSQGSEQSLGHIRNGNNQFRWKISGFTECTHTCGGGVQRANIICVSVTTRTQVEVTSENCADHLKPKTQTVQCNTQPCEPAWEPKEWSECSVTCGSGTQTRIVECQQRFSPFLILKVSADQCGLEKKPAVAQKCKVKSCGGGERKRSLQCVDRLDNEITPSHCSEAAPKYFERCNTQPCTSAAQWWITDWSGECSATCGEGYRSREIGCVEDNKRVSDNCDDITRPTSQETCILLICPQTKNTQKINRPGLAFYEDLSTPVHLEEVYAFEAFLKKTMEDISPSSIITVVGGFRRGKASGHDIDILITHPTEGEEAQILPKLLEVLEKNVFILRGQTMKNTYSSEILHQDSKTNLRSHFDHFEKWLGICKFPKSFRGISDSSQDNLDKEFQSTQSHQQYLQPHCSSLLKPSKHIDLDNCDRSNQQCYDQHPNEKDKGHPANSTRDRAETDESDGPEIKRCKHENLNESEVKSLAAKDRDWIARRVDLIVASYSQYFYALVGWTGSKHFNRDARLYAQKVLGLRLTSHGLYNIKKV